MPGEEARGLLMEELHEYAAPGRKPRSEHLPLLDENFLSSVAELKAHLFGSFVAGQSRFAVTHFPELLANLNEEEHAVLQVKRTNALLTRVREAVQAKIDTAETTELLAQAREMFQQSELNMPEAEIEVWALIAVAEAKLSHASTSMPSTVSARRLWRNKRKRFSDRRISPQ